MSKGRILIVDDETAFCELCGLWLSQAGYEVVSAHHGDQAKMIFAAQEIDLVLHDLALPPSFLPEEGLKLISQYATSPVVVLTGHNEQGLALQAIKQGAWDFLGKPLDPDMLLVVVARALEKARLQKQIKQLEQELEQDNDNLGLIGMSQEMQQTRELIKRIAPTQVAVLIQGPSGTGKEIIAKAVHKLSDRRDKPFVSVHCGAIPAELLESELFGYKKGAFTGADQDRKGLLASAHGGTLFLDEIGEMPLNMQVKLLRVLQEGSYYPVGGREIEQIDIRLVSATNRDLLKEIEQNHFRDDLYYRIKGLCLVTQALNQRPEDIPLLLNHFLALWNQKHQTQLRLSNDAMSWFCQRPWRGNVRELKNTLESTASITIKDELGLTDIALIQGDSPQQASVGTSLEEQVTALEIRLIKQALGQYNNNRTHAAQALGLTRQGLLKKIARYHI